MKINKNVQFILNLAKIQTVLSRKFDASLNGISLNEFLILTQLHQANDHKMRRTDLAEKVGLTASGVTRLLLPMEKIGLVKKESDPRDARTSYVVLARGGKTKFDEALERAELLTAELIPKNKDRSMGTASEFLAELIKNL